MKQYEAGHYMNNEIHDYDVFPKFYPAGKEVTITTKPLGAHALSSNKDVVIMAKYNAGEHTRDEADALMSRKY